LVGYKLSPLLWRKVRKGLSAGRVQSVAVKIIADRDKAIAEFVPEEFWTIRAKLREDAKAPIFTAEVMKKAGTKLELHNAQDALAVETDLKQAAYKVEAAFRKSVSRRALPPFTTSTLQQEASHKLNFTTRRTMMVAQQLYEGVNVGKSSAGLITYMRTDSTRLAAEATDSIREFVTQLFGPEYCPEKPNTFSNKNNAQDAHEAIRPTSVARTPSEMEPYLTKEQYLLYKLIWDRTMACQMTPAQYEQTTLTIGAGDYELKAVGSVMIFDGHLRLADKKELNAEKQVEVPFIKSGTELVLHKVLPGEQHFTEPPAHYTEASLVKKMEEEGIGRPSTYSPIIQTIQTRGYVAREGKKLMATELGIKVADMLTGHFGDIINIPYSARMENELDAIAAHQADMKKILSDFYGPFEELLEEADKVIPKDPPPLELSGEKCELCGKDMVIREGRFGKFQACSGFPQCHNTKPLLVKIGVPCPNCGGEVTERRTRTGRVFYGCENYPGCEFVSWDKPTTQPCPVCGKQLLERKEGNGKIKYFCSNPECENAAPKRAGRKKKVTTASLLEGEGENSGTGQVKKSAAKKKATKKKTAARKRTRKAAAKK
ncbi:MAG: type I DNA topoisomerase, partial [Acidaminococcaceae bacterium]|nr:type I DNA topoisomerase [Acidaminococcaceae bacterium]